MPLACLFRRKRFFIQRRRSRGRPKALPYDWRDLRLSLAGLAARTGIAKPNLSRLENSGHTTPNLDTLERYAQAVGKTLRVELVDAA